MAWFKRVKKSIEKPVPPDERSVRTEGLWTKCRIVPHDHLEKRSGSESARLPEVPASFSDGRNRRGLELLLDGRWIEHDAELASTDPLKFTDTKPYAARLRDMQRKLGMKDAIVTAEGMLNGRPVMCCAMEFRFIGGSMGAVVGEKVTRAIELAMEQRVPLVIVSVFRRTRA